ncbi:MAG: flagellar export protein FliJ [Comamonadaceae bacterium]|nr:flagellar export protein FliJ [Rubrivivax sp.]NLZ41362.1 flagellar export protein FliJ [Comamonadaceae bacterium]
MHDHRIPLQALLRHAESERDAAQAALLGAAARAQQLARQAEQLLAYRDDYRRRAPAHGAQAAGIALVRSHRDFMQRLEQAIEQQRAQQEAAERDAAAAREALRALELRVASVGKLLERREVQQQQRAARSEQRRHDEAAQRAAWTQRARSAAG